MKLVVDANELFSAIIAKGRGRNTKKLDLLFSDEIELFAPSLLFKEMERNSEILKSKSRFSDDEFNIFAEILKNEIKTVSLNEFEDKLNEAKSICPDIKDISYFALALKLNCPIWSGDKLLKQQSSVRVLNTKELLKELNL